MSIVGVKKVKTEKSGCFRQPLFQCQNVCGERYAKCLQNGVSIQGEGNAVIERRIVLDNQYVSFSHSSLSSLLFSIL